jgi:hypothetical protein
MTANRPREICANNCTSVTEVIILSMEVQLSSLIAYTAGSDKLMSLILLTKSFTLFYELNQPEPYTQNQIIIIITAKKVVNKDKRTVYIDPLPPT